MNDKIEELKNIFLKYRYTCESLTVEKILKECKHIKNKNDFCKTYEELEELEKIEEWKNSQPI